MIGVAAGAGDVIGTGAAALRGVAAFLAAFLATCFFAFAFFAAGFRRDAILTFFLREGAAFRAAFLTFRLAFRFLAMIVLPMVRPPTDRYAVVAARPCKASGIGPPVAQSINSTG